MDDLVRWLSEQLDEDERIARAAGGSWRELSGNWVVPDSYEPGTQMGRVAMVLGADERAHIAAHDPARVLREIDSKRQLLAMYEQAQRNANLPHPEHVDGVYPPAVFVSGFASGLEHTLRLHAAVYADRPGYQESWRPT